MFIWTKNRLILSIESVFNQRISKIDCCESMSILIQGAEHQENEKTAKL